MWFKILQIYCRNSFRCQKSKISFSGFKSGFSAGLCSLQNTGESVSLLFLAFELHSSAPGSFLPLQSVFRSFSASIILPSPLCVLSSPASRLYLRTHGGPTGIIQNNLPVAKSFSYLQSSFCHVTSICSRDWSLDIFGVSLQPPAKAFQKEGRARRRL